LLNQARLHCFLVWYRSIYFRFVFSILFYIAKYGVEVTSSDVFACVLALEFVFLDFSALSLCYICLLFISIYTLMDNWIIMTSSPTTQLLSPIDTGLCTCRFPNNPFCWMGLACNQRSDIAVCLLTCTSFWLNSINTFDCEPCIYCADYSPYRINSGILIWAYNAKEVFEFILHFLLIFYLVLND